MSEPPGRSATAPPPGPPAALPPTVRAGWLLVAAAEVPAGDGWLHPQEAEVAARLAVPGRRADYRLGRWAAKRALAGWLGVAADEAAFARLAVLPDPDGAPAARLDGSPLPLVLSFGHRAGRAACAVAPAGTALGCDLEWIEPRSADFVRDFFTPAEQALVAAAPESERPLLANLVWSAKESALKALRTGLRLDTWELEVVLGAAPGDGEREGWRPLAVARERTGQTFHGWWRREGEHVVTLAASPAPAVPGWLGTAPPPPAALVRGDAGPAC